MCPKNLRTYILRVPPFTENYGEYEVANVITKEMHDLSARTKFPNARFPIAAIDNVENSCRDTVYLPKNGKNALN